MDGSTHQARASLQQAHLGQGLAEASLCQQCWGQEFGLWNQPEEEAQGEGHQESTQRPGRQQPWLIGEGSPGAGNHDGVQHRRSKQEAKGRAQRRTACDEPSRHGDVAAFTGWQGKTQGRSCDGAEEWMVRQALQPASPWREPAG